MSLEIPPKRLESFLNHNGLNPILYEAEKTPLSKMFSRDLWDYVNENIETLSVKYKTSFPSHVRNAIGQFALNHITYDEMIHYDSLQLSNKHNFQIFLDRYFNYWGR